MNKNQWEQERISVKQAELSFLKKRSFSGTDYINKKIAGVIPFELEDKLEIAFRKSFAVIFELGGKTHSENSVDFAESHISELQKNTSKMKVNQTVFAGVEGVSLGILGIGLPDIPIFIVLLNQNIRKIAASYGFSVITERDKIFLLKIITAAFGSEQQKKQENYKLGKMIIDKNYELPTLKKAIEAAAKALAGEMLYLKFIQGIPLVGVIGGVSNPICINKVSGYAELVYQKKYLYRIGKENGFI